MAQNQPIITGIETFGQWDSTAAGELPRYWDGFNRQVIINGNNFGEVICVTKDSADPQDMDYSVRLENKVVLGGGAVPGMLTNGNLNIDFMSQNGDITGGYPYSQKPSSFKGWYKYNPANGDTALISIWFKQAGQEIGGGEIKIANSTNLWTQFNVNINFLIGTQPDTMVILIASSSKKNNVPPGSVLDIDHIWLEGGTLSSNNLDNNSPKFNIYPNPSSDFINIETMENGGKNNINIYNCLGEKVLTSYFNSTNHRVDINSLTPGIYYMELINNSGRTIKNIIIE